MLSELTAGPGFTRFIGHGVNESWTQVLSRFAPRMRMHFSSSRLSLFSLEVNSLLLSSLRKVFQVRNFRKSLIVKLCYMMQT